MWFLPIFAAKNGNSYLVRGIVRDSVSNEPLPYASVILPGTRYSAVAASDGIFEIAVPDGSPYLVVNCVGYDRKILPLHRNSLNLYVAYLKPSVTELDELIVKKKKYSKKNNPAIDFLNKLKNEAGRHNPLNQPFYSYDKYEIISVGLNDYHAESSGAGKKFKFLEEHVDTSDISGKPYLSLMVKEKRAVVNHRSNPASDKERVEAVRQAGVDEIVDQESMRVFFEDVMRETDVYDNDINLLQNRFVSPLSKIAPDFYRFYLTDTIEMDGEKCVVLSFYPRNKASFGFNGHIYVGAGDTTMFVRHVDMTVPKDINLNFVDNLYLSQDFVRDEKGMRHKTSDILTLEMSYMGKGSIYASKRTYYDDFSYDEIPDSVFDHGGSSYMVNDAASRDDSYWDQARIHGISRGEKKVDLLMQRLRRVPLFYWGEKVLHIAFAGYIPTGGQSKFDIGPVNAMLSFNDIEKVRLRVGGMTTAALSPRWFGRFYTAYGIRDHRWKYGAEAEYSFVDKRLHSREFPVKSIRLESQYDLMYPGEQYEFTSPDNIVLSLKRMKDIRALYRRHNRIAFNWETESNITVNIALSNERSTPVMPMTLTTGNGDLLPALTGNSIELTLRYAPGEKFFQTRSYRIPVNLDAPAITLRHTLSPRGLFGTTYGVNKTSLHIAKRWWLSAFGYIDTYAGGGHIWGKTDWLSLFTPNVNLSYTIQPESFALLNPVEFVCSSYAMWDITYWANGALLNQIPLLKKLKLRETVGFRGYWGTLAQNCRPDQHLDLLQLPQETSPEGMTDGPYMEMSAGLDNIFKVLRIEYVWRLNYREMSYEIDRHGLRIAIHTTF